MFKQASFAAAAIALTLASGAALAQTAERNVFDTETYQRIPATSAAQGLTREQVRAEFLASRARGNTNVFDTETVAYAPVKSAEKLVVLAQAKQ